MSTKNNLFDEISTVDFLHEYFRINCLPEIQRLSKNIINLSESQLKDLAEALTSKHKIEGIDKNMFNKYEKPTLMSKPARDPECDDLKGREYLFVVYKFQHSTKILDLFELYPKNFAGDIIDKRHSEITKKYIEFHINSDHCNVVIPADKKLVIEQKRDKVIEDIERKVVGINSEIEEFNNGLCEQLYILIIEKRNDFIDKNNNMNGL